MWNSDIKKEIQISEIILLGEIIILNLLITQSKFLQLDCDLRTNHFHENLI